MNWEICGPINVRDSIHVKNLKVDEFVDSSVNNVDSTSVCFNGIYHPRYNQLDLNEVFSISNPEEDTTLMGKTFYLHSTLSSEKERDLFIEMKSGMNCDLFLNGDSLHRVDIQGLNIYPLHLKSGDNCLLSKAISCCPDNSFEATIYDSLTIAQIYAEGQSNNIMYAIIKPETHRIMLTNAHQNVLKQNVVVAINDINGKEVSKFTLTKDSFTYVIPNLPLYTSYMCSMNMAGTIVRQPILYGNEDKALDRFKKLRVSIPDNHPRADEVDGLLYRLEFLLNHPSRKDGDWWWQFKIPALTYSLEYIFAHLNETTKANNLQNNIQFITYRSELDDSLQHYIMVQPNELPEADSLPLVVVIRPNIINYHPFFSCPQLARQWAVNQMQMMSNHYGFLIMMPEMRTYQKEDISEKAEKELCLAIANAKKRWPIDSKNIYLHGNCTGGYRALRIATDMPKMFAGIALYAPVYHCPYYSVESTKSTPETNIMKINKIPILVHGDPLDVHSPINQYIDFIKDCEDTKSSLSLSIKRNSGKYYNTALVGAEALEFFFKIKSNQRQK